VVLCIDVEPAGQERPDPTPGPWPETVSAHEWLSGVRDRVAAATGAPARFGWFLRMDPQVEALYGSATHAVDVHPDLIADARAHGDDLGLHIHAWRRVGDDWVDDFADPEWLDRSLDTAFAAYERAFAEPCRVTRMGFRYLSDRVVAGLARHGVEVDLTSEASRPPVAAGDQPNVTAGLPDERGTPRGPHHRGEGGPVFLPLSATRRQVGLRHLRHRARRALRQGEASLDQHFTLRQVVEPPDSFVARVERSLRAQRRPYLAFALHTGNSDDALRALVDRNLDALLASPLAPSLSFTTPRSAWAMLSG
jgi:hypothetical protein